MKNHAIRRWIYRHELLSIILMSTVFCSLYTVLFWGGKELLWFSILGNVFVIFLCCRIVLNQKYVLISRADSIRNHKCDPEPLLEEVNLQLEFFKNTKYEQRLLNARGAVLNAMGEYEKSYEISLSVLKANLKDNNHTHNVIFYGNVSSSLYKLGRYEEAHEYYSKATEEYEKIKKPEEKYYHKSYIDSFRVTDLMSKGCYREALNLIESLDKEESLSAEIVWGALKSARCYIGLGEYDKAREKLEYVIANGNKLYAVTEAKELLGTLNNSEQQ
ncbi:MAG: tetratricopeptide repeat protein [Ruminococcaceae bacterium]|nr:tetratricopeptide repeat protein [Oscillospiraceae bacterium]